MRPWRLGGYRPGAALFAAAILVPCLVLGGAGLYLVRQERELAGKRLADSHRRAAEQTRSALYAHLEQLKLRELRNCSPSRPAGDPAVVVVRVLEDARAMLPWESGREWGGEFARAVEEGEQEEFARGRPAAAIEAYQRALGSARSAAQSAYGRLALARAFNKQGRSAEARHVLEELLRTPPAVRDEFGVPFALYAIDRLLRGAAPETLSPYFRSAMREPALSATGLFLLKRLAGPLITSDERRLIGDRIEWAERAEELKRIAPELLARHGTGGDKPAWTAFGDPPWLATVDTALGAPEKILIAVRADPGVPGASLSTRESTGNLPLGDPFPGLRLQLPASFDSLVASEFRTRERFLWAALALVLAATSFAGFASWNGMRREIASAKVRTEFVESVTHELRTPLSSIRMFAETLRHRVPEGSRMQAECLDTIVGESERLTRLVDNVLDFSKIEQGRKRYRMAPVELPRVIEAVARAMRYPLELKSFSLEVMVNPDLPAITGDADSLEQAILNLLSNAVKYSGEAREIRLTAERDGGEAVIRVQDKGVGIAPDQLGRIFERFYRAPAEGQETTGAGLGLTLVEHIAWAHGGSVTVESAPGQGSTDRGGGMICDARPRRFFWSSAQPPWWRRRFLLTSPSSGWQRPAWARTSFSAPSSHIPASTRPHRAGGRRYHGVSTPAPAAAKGRQRIQDRYRRRVAVSGGATRDALTFDGSKVAPRTYEISLPNLGPGECGLLPPAGADMTGATGRIGKLYSFQIVE